MTRQLTELYSEIDAFLDWGNRKTTFPAEEFRLHTILWFLADESGDTDTATANAKRAIAASQKEHSGFANHPTTGLAGTPDATVMARLRELAD